MYADVLMCIKSSNNGDTVRQEVKIPDDFSLASRNPANSLVDRRVLQLFVGLSSQRQVPASGSLLCRVESGFVVSIMKSRGVEPKTVAAVPAQ
jgi:hypothetical protein